ncbi:hypothetical protein AB0J47_39960 [Nocardia sp. NPDC049737]|uniref:hypothetical protein n=1 Tax=Nocardia sp. NPDC049737 TaxID=3154358 RepID=UPI00341E5235
MRAATPPKDWKDFLDRQFLLISSKHWTGKTTAQFGAALAVIALVFVGVVLTLGWVCGPTSAVITGAAGLAAGGGAGVGAVWKIARRHQQLPPSSSASHTESGQEDESDTDTPRAA